MFVSLGWLYLKVLTVSRDKDIRALVLSPPFHPVLWLVGAVKTNLHAEGHIFKGMKNAKTIAICKCGATGRCERWRKEIFSMFTFINSLELSNYIFCFDIFWPHSVFLYSVQTCAINTFSASCRYQCIFFFPIRVLGSLVAVRRNKDIRCLVLLSFYFPCLLFVVWL